MGFFSWKTQDTNRSIANCYSNRPTFPVTMTDDKGNKWTEKEYEGYGEFGGKDYYELMAEMNGFGSDRSKGIDLAFDGCSMGESKKWKHPNLNEDQNLEWRNECPTGCEAQGYFYEESEDVFFEEDEE